MPDLTLKIKFNSDVLNPLLSMDDNKRIQFACNNTLFKMCDPYVPMQSGNLAQSALVSSKGVQYSYGAAKDYAAYQYYGEVYGPSWPIKQDGVIVGWRSPKGKGTKHPTGRKLNYSTQAHPLATSFWDKAMLRDHHDEFCLEIKQIINNEYNWLRRNGR